MFSPAKLNLFLAVTGRRPDGFHDLVSVAAPLTFGDTLQVEPAATFSLSCDHPDVPAGEANLVLRAARAYVAASGWQGAAAFRLEKRIPVAAGLGGGSSNAVAALLGLNRLAGGLLDDRRLREVAAELGSDCPLFLDGGPVVIRGRGERVEPLPAAVSSRIRGRRVLVFRPGFGVETPWAYAQLAARAPKGYLAAEGVESRWAQWCANPAAPLEDLLFNSLEPPVFAKHLALPTLLAQLATRFGLQARMSGSGSACFVLLGDSTPESPVMQAIREAWGPSALAIEARLA